MAKFTIIIATFTALLLLLDASIYRTATLVVDEENPRHTREACWKQIERQQNLRDCQQYITQEFNHRASGPSMTEGQADSLTVGCK
ncbi:unnamed protein product [Dovyalis caffra]|uniref:Uncharacterized protein n=1 Tax=Dovyalis caffra TaxID=77055 RepID=A0AAV1SCE5_9ROSI|nr:unnamed protein product [Dovyalis caffra]